MSISARKLTRAVTHSSTGGVPTGYNFQSTAIYGGGFQNAVAISPFLDSDGNRPYVMAADISNVFYSVDKAQTWKPVGDLGAHNAAVLWSDVTAGKVYVAGDEGLWLSTDFGKSWSSQSLPTNYNQDSNGNYQINSNEHPRSTGNMIQQDNTGSTKYLWVATASKGVQRRDNGNWITSNALNGYHLRSIASDPNNPDLLYVAVANDSDPATSGIYRSINARGAMTFTKMSNYPPTVNNTNQYVEELFFIDDNGTSRLYVAGNNDGIFCYAGTTWTALNNGVDTATGTSGPKWLSITGYRASNGSIILYAGSVDAVQDTANPKRLRVLMRSANGGGNWTYISTAANASVSATVYDTSQNAWFPATGHYLSFAGNSQWCGASLAVDPDRTDQLLVAGRAGAWMGTLNSGSWTWQPSINGVMATVNKSVVTDPTVDGGVAWSNGDFTFFSSKNHGTTVYVDAPGFPSNPTAPVKGDRAAFDKNGVIYVSTSPRGNDSGSDAAIASNSSPYFAGGTWVDEQLPAAVVNDAPALGVGFNSSNTRILLAGLNSNGFWRKSGATWSQITNGPFTGAVNNGYFSWYLGGPLVYAMDDSSGVWRSNTAGSQGSWVQIHGARATYNPSETIAVDPTNASYLYFSANDNLYRITNADTSTSIAASNVSILTGVPHAASIAVSAEGNLFVHDDGGTGKLGRLWRSLNPKSALPTFSVVSDNFYYNACGSIKSLAVASDGYIYTADSGRGATVGVPYY